MSLIGALKELGCRAALFLALPIIFILALLLVRKLEKDSTAYGFLKYLEEDEVEEM